MRNQETKTITDLGVLVYDFTLTLWEKAPVGEWKGDGNEIEYDIHDYYFYTDNDDEYLTFMEKLTGLSLEDIVNNENELWIAYYDKIKEHYREQAEKQATEIYQEEWDRRRL